MQGPIHVSRSGDVKQGREIIGRVEREGRRWRFVTTGGTDSGRTFARQSDAALALAEYVGELVIAAAHETVGAMLAKQRARTALYPEHNCDENPVPYVSDGALGHGWECGICGAFLQAG